MVAIYVNVLTVFPYTGPKNILKLFCFSSDVSYKVLLRGKSISGDPKKDSSLLLEEIEPLRKKWKQGKTKVRRNVMENRILLVYSDINFHLCSSNNDKVGIIFEKTTDCPDGESHSRSSIERMYQRSERDVC